ncbi:sensor histidine kinase [Mesobacillus jeotgali]|uniref:sensor histidine kinase n=1 Tax=Mesobacillus jeotgali TaxID=129985 RepID=UPI0009A8D227|nr:HAMP domain-containing sensor histidine kinase [Mesobacillus jeotgali]
MRGIKRDLTLYFIFRFLFLLIMVMMFLGGMILYLSYQILQNETKGNFHRTTREYLESSLHRENGEIRIENKMKQAVKTQNGWVQILNESGEAVEGYHVPEGVPERYELNDFLTPALSLPYQVSRWNITIDKEEYIVLYGHSSKSSELYEQIAGYAAADTIPKEVKRLADKEKAAIFLLNHEGRMIEQYDGGLEPEINFIDLQQSYEYNPEAKYEIASGADPETGNILTVVTLNQTQMDGKENDKALKVFIAFLLLLLLILLLVSVNYGMKIGRGVLFIMDWINQLAKGEYPQEKLSPKGHTESAFFNRIYHSLTNLTRTLDENKREIEGNERLREEWIAGLTHDLKTPISSIYGYSKLLQADPERWSLDELKIMGNTMTEKSDYIIELINDLTLSNQLANSSLNLEKERVDVRVILQHSIASLKLELERNKSEIQFESDPSEVMWPVDPTGFRRISDNLLANAVKHNAAGTKIAVKLDRRNGALYLSVRDNGNGMDEITQRNLFRRYYRGTHTKERDSGTGLGMAITRQLILAHGGSLELKSKIGEGTEILVWFPGE